MEKQWYELNNHERKRYIFDSFSIADFWSWWSDNEFKYMEIRFGSGDFKEIVNFAKQNNMPFAKSGIFVSNPQQLKQVINHFREKTKIWFGVNPRRRLYNQYGKKTIRGLDVYIEEIKFLFIDIDRKRKEGAASYEDLMNADFAANKVIEHFQKGGFAHNYMKICSGNGVQLLFKLDVPFTLPHPSYNEEGGMYYEDRLFIDTKDTLRNGIRHVLTHFSKKFFENEYNIEIDSTCFNMNRVGALHKTFNFKHNDKIPRGIVELHDESVNEGLSDYLRELAINNKKRASSKKEFSSKSKDLISKENREMKNALHKNAIIDLMLRYTFPDGGINNTLWYAIKLLLHDNGIDNTHPEYIQMHQKLKSIHDRSFSDNGLEPQFKNNYTGPFKEGDVNIVPSMVNKYLRMHKIRRISDGKEGLYPPLFSVSPFGKTKEQYTINISPGLLKYEPKNIYNMSEYMNDPLQDICDIAKKLYEIRCGKELDEEHIKGKNTFTEIGEVLLINQLHDYFIDFLHKFRNKWGDKMTAYMMKHYMHDYLNYKRW